MTIFLRHLVPWPSVDIHRKFHGDPPGELKTRGLEKYSDFGPIEGYISETEQDKLVLITNRKSYLGFRLVSKSVTLNDLERRGFLRYLSDFGSFQRALRKSG